MRQDKDRSGKWLLAHHGDAILKLAGMTGFNSWRAIHTETVAPRRLPDGLLEVRFPGESAPILVLVEIETYPDSDADRQVLDDLMLIAVDRGLVPEVVSLILKPKGNLAVAGAAERTSSRGRTRLGGSWPVVRLWELDAESLLNANDAGLIPWVPLTRTTSPPDELMARCRDRLMQVPDEGDREGLISVTQILAGLAFPGQDFKSLFGVKAMMEKVFLEALLTPAMSEVRESVFAKLKAEMKAEVREEVKTEIETQARAKVLAETRLLTLREAVLTILQARFGSVPAEQVPAVNAIADEVRLRELQRLAATCPDLAAFAAGLTGSA